MNKYQNEKTDSKRKSKKKMKMITQQDLQKKIDFNSKWNYYSYSSSDLTTVLHTINTNDPRWSVIDLPHHLDHSIDQNGHHKNALNYWYYKQFQCQVRKPIFLLLEIGPNDPDDANSTIELLTIWLNKIQIFSDSFESKQITVELPEEYLYLNDDQQSEHLNTLIICCYKVSLYLHVFLLFSDSSTESIPIENTHLQVPLRRNRVLDYLVQFNPDDGCFNLSMNPKFKSNLNSPSLLKPLDIIINEDDSTIDDQSSQIPRLNIVMLVVGTRGDVQPFVAFGQTLRRAGHRVRLATHEKFRQYVRENELEFYPIASNPDDLMSFMVKNGGIVPSMASIIEGDLKKKRRDITAILNSTWKACIDNDDETSAPFIAEVIIANPPSFGHIHCAQKLQIPLHMMFTMPWSATTAFPHAFCKIDYSKSSSDKLNLLSYSLIDTLTWSSMADLVNDFRRDVLGLPPLHTRQGIRIMIDERVPHTYCWSPSLVPRPKDWPEHIDIAGYFFLNNDTSKYKPSYELATFLGLHQTNLIESKSPPPVYIGFGSVTGNNSHRLFEVICEALRQTGYRAIVSGFEKETNPLSDIILKVGDIPHDWLFPYVSAVCHHGGAGTTAAGLRAGKPSIIVPFFGDQFFWGNVVAKLGAGPSPICGRNITVEGFIEALKKAHEPDVQTTAEHIRRTLAKENGCEAALKIFHSHLPLSRMRSDLESTFAACYRIDEYDLQVSRPVAQVLVAVGVLDESQFRSHATREWTSIYDYRIHLPTSGAIKHTQKAVSHMFIRPAHDMRRAVSSENLIVGVGHVCEDVAKGIGHLSLCVLSLYGELTDVLDRLPILYDPYSKLDTRERPRVIDFKSGAKAAGLAIAHGWTDGLAGLVRKPRVGYRRHGVLGGATGILVAAANGVVKPTAGSLASVTWLGRGLYATMKKKRRKDHKADKHLLINKLSIRSSFSSLSSDQETEDDEKDVSNSIKFASIISGYSAEMCERILGEFEEVKKHHEAMAAQSPKSTSAGQRRNFFRRTRHYSDSAI